MDGHEALESSFITAAITSSLMQITAKSIEFFRKATNQINTDKRLADNIKCLSFWVKN
jgi:hypothetical protein